MSQLTGGSAGSADPHSQQPASREGDGPVPGTQHSVSRGGMPAAPGRARGFRAGRYLLALAAALILVLTGGTVGAVIALHHAPPAKTVTVAAPPGPGTAMPAQQLARAAAAAAAR